MTRLLQKKMIGGFPLKKFYPELGNAALWCCTELNSEEGIDRRSGHRRWASEREQGDYSKATPTSTRMKALIFERSSPGKKGLQLAAAGCA